MSEDLKVIVEADGGSRGNPGPAGYGAVVFDATTGEVLAERKQAIGIDTNNVAEYQGLIAGLTAARELGARAVAVRMDSKLVVEQMSGRWQVKHPSMRPLARQAAELRRDFAEITFTWIPREQNKYADRLANEAMDAAAGKPLKSAGTGATLVAPVSMPIQETLDGPTPQTAWLPPNSTPTRLILLRHGVTEYTLAKRFAGRSDLDLLDEGRTQAEQAAERIARLGPVNAVVSSPLRRTRQTAQVVADRLGVDAGIDFDIEIEDGFAETDFGDWDGHTYPEVEARWPGQLAKWLNDPAVAPPGGESFEAVTRRVRRARDRVLAAHTDETVLVVTHVSPIKILVRLALDAPPSALHRMYLAPASISVVDYYPDGPVTLRSFNDSAQL
ncbi:MAG: ribonuclease / adenosylcobalamin/alpha-ribazole phosphatase [Pseudonocardiales bacterium]|nr:ribonuclease / adenosylcobalamin/alpha-ribazole phosphatase [Pseudonocardiales bacterium]